MSTVFELQEQRAKLVHDMRAVLDTADAAGRDLTAEEEGQYQTIESDLEALDLDIQNKQSAESRRLRLEEAESRNTEIRNLGQRSRKLGGNGSAVSKPHWMAELTAAMARREGRREALQEFEATASQDPGVSERNREFVRFLQSGGYEAGSSLREYSALQMDVDSAGGTLVPDEVFLSRFIQGLDERVFMRQICTVLPMVNAKSVGIAAESADPADADWTGEILTGSLDTALTTSKRILRPRPVAKRILVSKTLLRHSAMAETFVRDRMLFKLGVTEEKGFLTGHGAGQPLGVFTASADGITTARDVSTDNTTTNVTADGLMNAKYSLAAQYLTSANLRWIFHRTTVRNIRKLKDGNGQYIWSAGLGGEPNTLLDTPVIMSEYAPSTFTTGLYVGLIGDFSYYYIADALTMTIQRLVELHAATNQDGFYVRAEVDGMPVLAEAFARVKLG